jgi:predicted transcriptional regulator
MQTEFNLISLIEKLTPFLIVAIPGIWSLVETRLDKRKKRASAELDEATAADKLSASALSLVKYHEEDTKRFREMAEHYSNIAEKLKESFEGCKDKLDTLSDEIVCIKDADNKRMLENAELTKQNVELIKKVELLEKIVKELVNQLKDLGVEPKYGKREQDNLGGK